MSHLISINPIVTPEHFQRLMAAAAADNHVPIYPTHAVVKDGEITGSLSICAIPVFTFWSHSQKHNARNSLEVFNLGKNLAFEKSGRRPVLTWCPVTSPLYPFMAKLGFREHITTTHFLQEDK